MKREGISFMDNGNHKLNSIITALCISVSILLWANCAYSETPEEITLFIWKAISENLIVNNPDDHVSNPTISDNDCYSKDVSGAPPIEETQIDSWMMRFVINVRLDPGLLKSLQTFRGSNFEFNLLYQYDKGKYYYKDQLAVLVLTYDQNVHATRNARKLEHLRGYFRQSKVLTLFSYTVVSNKIVIAFTERSFEKKVAEFVNDIPELLQIIK